MNSVAEVRLWGTTIGAVMLTEASPYAVFEYETSFLSSGIPVAPLTMPLARTLYRFPELSLQAFHGLPGLLADTLPDKFGTALIDAWLSTRGRTPDSFNVVERLCYIGSRGMGALEFYPNTGLQATDGHELEIASLVELASDILTKRKALATSFEYDESHHAIRDILRVGTSAGGARAKAIIAWNPETDDIRSGQVDPGSGYEYWLLKFDGVQNNRDKELSDPQGYGVIEYAYNQLAVMAGIDMMECRILEEGERRHFMTKRFDRTANGKKIHMQTLAALAHFDFNMAGAYSYEQAIMVMQQLGISQPRQEQLFRRMVFNVIMRNQDDHVKNIAFLMNKAGDWDLSPAYDVTYSYNPQGRWTSTHQMMINGKRDGFTVDDLRACAKRIAMKRGRADAIIEDVIAASTSWVDVAESLGIDVPLISAIQNSIRTSIRL